MLFWQWEVRQQANLIALHLVQAGPGRPTINMVTEAGIVGKIGLNSAGVGVCLNAIRARGVHWGRLPTHIALRTALECTSYAEAAATLERVGVATSCHILVADRTGAVGLEFSHADLQKLPLDAASGRLVHSNHFLVPHRTPDGAGEPIRETVFLDDSPLRVARIEELLVRAQARGLGPTLETVAKQLEDEDNFPTAINRAVKPGSQVATLFSIVMDLVAVKATVRLGRPTESTESFVLQPAADKTS